MDTQYLHLKNVDPQHWLYREGKRTNKRDIYYQNAQIFRKQNQQNDLHTLFCFIVLLILLSN